jgi:hypothetical protein
MLKFMPNERHDALMTAAASSDVPYRSTMLLPLGVFVL